MVLDKMYKYKMDPTRTVGATERTLDAGQMDGGTDGGTDGMKPIYPQHLCCAQGIIKSINSIIKHSNIIQIVPSVKRGRKGNIAYWGLNKINFMLQRTWAFWMELLELKFCHLFEISFQFDLEASPENHHFFRQWFCAQQAISCANDDLVNPLRPRQNGRHFADDLFKCIFLNENIWILLEISLKFVPKGPISNIPALVQIMAWCRPGDKPLSETMMARLQTHICITRPQWVNEYINASPGLKELIFKIAHNGLWSLVPWRYQSHNDLIMLIFLN